MSYLKTIVRTAIVAITLLGAVGGSFTIVQPSALSFADSTGQHDDLDAG